MLAKICVKSLSIDTYFFLLWKTLFVSKDYVTEKLFRSLKLGIIPVVFGAVNYTAFAPPNSFIDATKFSSIRHLADFMKQVAKNASLYNSFFRWQEHYDIDVGFPYKAHICDLCKKLHSLSNLREPRTYSCIKDWFINKGQCYHFNKFAY
ncbi:Alpha-(1,3)-fucosyltransferase C [Armadillidium vulgare]|nr:Alpha-(1,3)-fucosyltransferase C [Armadillidium vulgare]